MVENNLKSFKNIFACKFFLPMKHLIVGKKISTVKNWTEHQSPFFPVIRYANFEGSSAFVF